jgi:hypothetical protein
MTEQQTDRLIAKLALDLEPTARVPRLRWVATAVLLMGSAMVGLKIALGGLRMDVRMLSVAPSYAVLLAALLLIAAGGLASALGASIPGRQAVVRFGVGALVGGFAAMTGVAVGLLVGAGAPPGAFTWASLFAGLRCLGNACLIAVVPGVALGVFVFRAAAHRPLLALSAAAGGAAGLGAAGVHLSCPADDTLHVLAFHALAPLLGGALLWLLLLALKARFHLRASQG